MVFGELVSPIFKNHFPSHLPLGKHNCDPQFRFAETRPLSILCIRELFPPPSHTSASSKSTRRHTVFIHWEKYNHARVCRCGITYCYTISTTPARKNHTTKLLYWACVYDSHFSDSVCVCVRAFLRHSVWLCWCPLWKISCLPARKARPSESNRIRASDKNPRRPCVSFFFPPIKDIFQLSSPLLAAAGGRKTTVENWIFQIASTSLKVCFSARVFPWKCLNLSEGFIEGTSEFGNLSSASRENLWKILLFDPAHGVF